MRKFQRAAIVLTSFVFPWLGVQVNQTAPVSESFPVVAQTAQTSALNLIQRGRGRLKIGNRGTRGIERASVIVRPLGTVDLGLTYSDGRGTLRFGGQLISHTEDSLTIALTNSGNADASGEVTVSYGPFSSINWISGKGFVDGKSLTFQFNGGSKDNVGSQPMNLSQTGSGLFTLQGRPNRDINRALLTVQRNGNADLALFLVDGTQVRFSGDVADQNAYVLNIRVTSSGMADASGNIQVEYGANNLINTIFGAGKLDNQDFSVQFSR